MVSSGHVEGKLPGPVQEAVEIWVRAQSRGWEHADVIGSLLAVDALGAEEVAKVMEHADGEKHLEQQHSRGRRREKGEGDWEGVAMEVGGSVRESCGQKGERRREWPTGQWS